MAGRKSSFLMRTRKVKDGERVEMTHLESQATGRFTSLDEALSWVRAKWTEWDSRPEEREDMPVPPAEGNGGMKRWWDNAWTGRALRRGEALILSVAVLLLAIFAGDPGVRGAVSEALGATQLSTSSATTPAELVGFATAHWTYTSGSNQTLAVEFDGLHTGATGMKTLLPAPNGAMRVYCFNLVLPARVAFAWRAQDNETGSGSRYLTSIAASGSADVANTQGQVTNYTYDCPSGYRDAALVHIGQSTNKFLNTGGTTTAAGNEGVFTIWFYR